MKQLYIKQKVFSLKEKFTVKDERGNDVYFVEGSFLKIPKSFSVKNTAGHEIALITKKVFSFLPKFFVEVNGKEEVIIKKEFTFFKPKYSIDAAGIEVNGNWWDMNFQVLQHGKVVGRVSKKLLSWGDSYSVDILEDHMEELIIALVIAIDCVKDSQDNNAASVVDI